MSSSVPFLFLLWKPVCRLLHTQKSASSCLSRRDELNWLICISWGLSWGQGWIKETLIIPHRPDIDVSSASCVAARSPDAAGGCFTAVLNCEKTSVTSLVLLPWRPCRTGSGLLECFTDLSSARFLEIWMLTHDPICSCWREEAGLRDYSQIDMIVCLKGWFL